MRRLSPRARANKLNAQKSTGPKSAAGKARSARNARQHGLAVPVVHVPELAGPVEELAGIIAGPNASVERLSYARLIAEATFDMERIRRAKVVLLTDPEARIVEPTFNDMLRGMRDVSAAAPGLVERASQETPTPFSDAENVRFVRMKRLHEKITAAENPPDMIGGLPKLLPRLSKLDRYEQRARSRLRKAVAAFGAEE